MLQHSLAGTAIGPEIRVYTFRAGLAVIPNAVIAHDVTLFDGGDVLQIP